MANKFVDVSDAFDSPRLLLQLIDDGETDPVTGEDVLSIAAGITSSELPNGAATETGLTNLLTELQGKADLDEIQPVVIQDSTGTNSADVISYEGDNSLRVAIGYQPTYTVHMDVDAQSGTVGYMLVDLSDTTNWPHSNTGHIVLKQIVIQSSQSSSPAFLGDIEFGFLSSVDADNGDFNRIGVLHGDRATALGGGNFDFSSVGLGLEVDEWFGPTSSNDATFQTDVNLLGPDGTTAYPSGNGDFVCKLVSSAGTISFGVTVIYTTVA